MKRKRIWIIGSVLIFLVLYIWVEVWIARDVERIVESGMKNDLSYQEYMTEKAYSKINPFKRGMDNYESKYTPENHTYTDVRPIHVFMRAWVTIDHLYKSTNTGSNERILLKLKLRNGKWIASDARIKP